ncbi:hypothetical protein [Aestuariispira insulae]|uniref:Uncharacterized protein n=1 Tax=Aestuariispira insulae TaxID=1461337 RepID=A0A3D9HT42_9PROT|nr:hypothetical protein [Aestuariispira insulae]RED52046.1 hypothetical protein DFP90_10263 [Aestuariispira insulae]
MNDRELLRIARFYAESFLEIAREPLPDIADCLAGIVGEEDDIGLLTAATLYTPVIHLMPSEDFIAKTYGKDVFNLLMETTYDPGLNLARRHRAIKARVRDMDARTKILQLAVLRGYAPLELSLMRSAGINARDYVQSLESVAASLRDTCPALYDQFLEDLDNVAL